MSVRRAPAFFFRPESWCSPVKDEEENENVKDENMNDSNHSNCKSKPSTIFVHGKGVVCKGFLPSHCTKCKKNVCNGCTDRCMGCGNVPTPVTHNQYFIATYTVKRK